MSAAAKKRELRDWARTQLPVSDEESTRVVGGLVRWLAEQPTGGVLAYLSMDGEIAADEVASHTEHRLYVTRTPARGPLSVHAFDAPREQHPYGFAQPAGDAPSADLDDIGIVLVPGLVFDRQGRRLGRGKGYYDRLLASLPGRTLVAVTLERFLLHAVPTQAHDLAMTHLATESGVVAI